MARQQQRWAILFGLLFIQVFMFGPTAGTIGVFIDPLIKTYGWSHAQVSQMATTYSFALGLGSFFAGWLLERVNARWVMVLGTFMAGAGEFLAAGIHSLGGLVSCYFLVGAGVAFASLTPAAVVAVEWFPERRGSAVAIAYFGIGLGMAIAPRLVTTIVMEHGWRWGMMAVGTPILLLALPVALFLVRSHPEAKGEREVSGAGAAEPDLAQALGTAGFWLVISLCILSQSGVGATFYHLIPYLVMVGYSPATASLVLGGQAILVSLGSILLGALTDCYGAKRVMASTFALLAVADMVLLGCGDPRWGLLSVVAFIIIWGINMGNIAVLPSLVAGALGLRRFSTFVGVASMFWLIGQGIGPIAAGAVFDITKTYALPFELAALSFGISAVLTVLVSPAQGVKRVVNRAELVA